jgi:hypothetical protein
MPGMKRCIPLKHLDNPKVHKRVLENLKQLQPRRVCEYRKGGDLVAFRGGGSVL